jgi:hypothetical protein
MMVIVEFHPISKRGIQYLELCGNVCIEHAEACSSNVLV